MNYTYYTKGTCSKQIDLEINGDVITNVKFYGGCDGNLKAIPALVNGLTVDEISNKLSGIQCGLKALPAATSWLMQSEKPMRLRKQPMPSKTLVCFD